jgi:hypothetical protein
LRCDGAKKEKVEMATTSRKNIMTIALGAMALITLATTVIIGKHYWDMLSGVFIIAVVGLALPDWVAWWGTYLHAKATKDGNEDPRVAHTSLVVSAGLSLVMILNAGAVLAVWWDDKKMAESSDRTAKALTETIRVHNAGNTEAIEARGRVIAQMRAQGASNKTIQEYIDAESKRDQAMTLTTAPPKDETATVPHVSQVPEPVQKYMSFWVFIIPALAGLFGLFALIISVQMPGGLEFEKGASVAKPVGFSPAPPLTTVTASQPPQSPNFFFPPTEPGK